MTAAEQNSLSTAVPFAEVGNQNTAASVAVFKILQPLNSHAARFIFDLEAKRM